MSSPMLGPLLIPETSRSGARSNIFPRATATQSVGVPSTAKRRWSRRLARSGRSRVRACETADCSRFGATTIGGSVQINAGGFITHSDNSTADAYKMDLTITGDLTVDAGGAVDVDDEQLTEKIDARIEEASPVKASHGSSGFRLETRDGLGTWCGLAVW